MSFECRGKLKPRVLEGDRLLEGGDCAVEALALPSVRCEEISVGGFDVWWFMFTVQSCLVFRVWGLGFGI